MERTVADSYVCPRIGFRRCKMVTVAKPLGNLSRTNMAYSLFEILGAWVLIAASFAIVGRVHPLVSAVPMLLAMTILQQALLTLLHDSWHGLLAKDRKINDFLGKYLISFPCIKLWNRLKQEHLAHHVHLGNRDSDPTFLLYGFEPGEPRNKPVRFIFRRLGGRILETIWRATQPAHEPVKKDAYWGSKRDLWKELVSMALLQGVLFLAIAAAAPWWTYFAFWVFPFFTTTAACNLIRTFCEHAHPLTDEGVPPTRRLISFKSNMVEVSFIAPLHFNYHAEHHLNMSVPHYRLPELRRRMEAAGRLGFPVRSTYFEVLREHFGRRPASEI